MDKVRIDFRDQISSNKWRSAFLLLGIAIVIVVLGYVISMALDPSYFMIIMVVASLFSIVYIWAGYYNSHKIAVSSVGARKASKTEHKVFYDLVEGLVIASGMPMPKLYVMHSDNINAFASGRDPKHAVICVTTGALKKLDRRELEGVLAHELGHIASYDIRYMTIVAVMVGMISIISQIFLRSLFFSGGRGGNDRSKAIYMLLAVLLAILAPIVVFFVQMSISRRKEFSADASAVKFTRYPNGLIGALKKIKKENAPETKKISKALAPLFISNPLKGLGSTHPPLEKRISVLEKM